MIRIIPLVILILFLVDKGVIAEDKKATPECVYTSTAEVVDGKLINHKEQIDCVEVKKPNVIVSAMTGENSGFFFQYVFGTLFFVVEHLL
tara:strand:+ start:863 stop:1132 length:270 start_codon:yes stop_codon:yes gene_type:complete